MPIEASLARAPGVAHVNGLAERGGATVEVSFVPGVASSDARAAVDGALPASRAARTVTVPSRAPPLHVELVGDVYPGAEVRSAFARVLRPRLVAVAGVTEVTICGGGVPRVLVEVDAYRARARGVDGAHIVSALQGALATATTAQDLAGATIADVNGSPVRVRDVADLSTSSGAPPCDAWRGAQPAVVGTVTLAPDADEARAVGELSRALGELELGALPPGMHAVPVDFDAHGHAPTVELRVYGLGDAGEETTSRALGRLLDAGGAALHEPTTLSFLGRTTSGAEPPPTATILARVAEAVGVRSCQATSLDVKPASIPLPDPES